MFTATLDTIQITQEWPDMVATFSCEVVDQGQGWEFVEEDEVRATFRDERIFAGHLSIVTEDRTDESGPRKWVLEAQDYTAKLGDAIIRQREHRKKERAIRRIRWIVGYLGHAWHIDDHEYDVPDEDVERQDMYGMTVAEALDSVINEVGLRPAWIDLDNKLWVVNAAHTVAAPFDLNNEAPDFVDSFPFREFTYRRDGLSRANAILVEPEKRSESRWAVSEANIADYEWGDSTGRKEQFVSAEEIRTARAAQRHANAQLQRTKAAEVEAGLVCFEPGIWVGMRPQLNEVLWEHDQTMRVIRVVITAMDPHDTNNTAYLRSELTLNNKPKRRSPKMGRPEDQSAPGPQTLDEFNRTVAPPTIVPGDAITLGNVFAFNATTQFRQGSTGILGGNQDYTSGPTFATHNWLHPLGSRDIFSRVGQTVTGHASRPPASQCTGFDFWFAGWLDTEEWRRFVVPAHPADAAGMFLNITVGAAWGAGAAGIQVVVKNDVPSATWQGSPVGTLPPGASGTVFVPIALVPAEGAYMYVGFQANWRTNYGFTYCGFGAVPDGSNNGNVAKTQLDSATWATSTDAEPTGTTDTGHTWQDAGVDGSPTYGVEDGAYYLEGPGGRGMYVSGEREDDTQSPGAWSGGGSDLSVVFSVDNLTVDGTRRIEVTTTGEGMTTVGTVHLGDASAAAGISVNGGASTEYLAKALTTDDKWVARFDSRSGSIRGKLWKIADGEPTEWDLITPLTDTEDDGDRLMLWLRAGTGQTISIHQLKTQARAAPGQHVVGEWLGLASGDTNAFMTDQPFEAETLRADIAGVGVAPVIEDGTATTFSIDHFPTATMAVRATYIADQGEGG